MKSLYRRLFYLDEPIQGAFFGLTLVLSVLWGLVSLLFVGMTYYGWWYPSLPTVIVLLVLGIILLSYLLVLLLQYLFLAKPFRLLCHRASCATILLAVLAWTGSFHVFWTLFVYAYDPFRPHGLNSTGFNEFLELTPYVAYLHDWFGLGGKGCFWFALLGGLLLAIAYLLTAKAIVFCSQISFRQLFGHGVRTLWGICLASYAVFLLLALIDRGNAIRERQRLEAHFCRPLTAVELGRCFYAGRSANPDYWRRFEEHMDDFYAISDQKMYNEWRFAEYPFGILPMEAYAKRQAAFYARKGRLELEDMLTAEIPPPAREYRDDKWLLSIELPEVSLLRKMARIEMQHLRFALDEKKGDEACKCIERLDNMVQYLFGDYWMVCHLTGAQIGQMRFEALERILASGLASDEWLKRQAEILAELEEMFLRTEGKALYGEAVTSLNILHNLGICPIEYGNEIYYPGLRLFFPQAWLFVENNAKNVSRAYQVDHVSQIPDERTHAYVYMFVPYFSRIERSYMQFSAAARALRGLIEAELHFRQTGEYPDTLENIPPDPFSGAPLKYAVGSCQVLNHVYREQKVDVELDPECEENLPPEPYFDFYTEETTIRAVQIWSVGPNGIDDGGLSDWENSGLSDWDDIRFLLPIND